MDGEGATITVSGATQAVVTETLPTGFAYVASSLPDSQVRPDVNDKESANIRFVLADSADNPFTYTVTVSEAGAIGATQAGKLTVDRIEYDVTGRRQLTVTGRVRRDRRRHGDRPGEHRPECDEGV